VIAILGAEESLIKLLVSEPLFQAPSVRVTVIDLVPSPLENVAGILNPPLLHGPFVAESNPEPVTITFKPVSQVPIRVTPLTVEEFAAGAVIATRGAVPST